VGRDRGTPEHPQLGRRVFSWSPPWSRRLLNAGLGVALFAALSVAGGLVALTGFGAAKVAAPLSFFFLYLVIWFVVRAPSGTPCAVYRRGISDGRRVLRWRDARVAPEATREFYGLWRSDLVYEHDSRFEILVLGDDGERFVIKGWGAPYDAYWRWFMERVVPGQVERDIAAFEAGEPLRVGQLTVDQQGFSHEQGGRLPWAEVGGSDLEDGQVRVFSRSDDSPVFEVPMFLSAAHSLRELLERRG